MPYCNRFPFQTNVWILMGPFVGINIPCDYQRFYCSLEFTRRKRSLLISSITTLFQSSGAVDNLFKDITMSRHIVLFLSCIVNLQCDYIVEHCKCFFTQNSFQHMGLIWIMKCFLVENRNFNRTDVNHSCFITLRNLRSALGD